MFAVSPRPPKGMKAISTASGIVITGISALGRCQRKSMMITEIVTMTSTIEEESVPIARRIRSERS